MINAFAEKVKEYPGQTCFTFVSKDNTEETFSYGYVQQLAGALARCLEEKGVQRGSYVALDLPNAPEVVLLFLSAAYGGFSLVLLNHRLTDAEKTDQINCIALKSGSSPALRIDTVKVQGLIGDAKTYINESGKNDITAFVSERRDIFDPSSCAVCMFTSGSTGAGKAVPLTWNNLILAAKATNSVLLKPGRGVWQAALPLYHVGGLQIVVRSLLNQTPFVLYEHFDATRVLDDTFGLHATHISVVDKMLQDLLAKAETSTEMRLMLQSYQCVLLGGGFLNPKTLARARKVDARVYASYGMTETTAAVACALVTERFDEGLRVLPGYQVSILSPDEEGFGRLAVEGPGVFSGYANVQTPKDEAGRFLTGDTAAYIRRSLYVRERIDDMFVSGGENISPGTIKKELLKLPGVTDAYVFGAMDATWGRRPVAFVECCDDTKKSKDLLDELAGRLSELSIPKNLYVLNKFPRTSTDKIDQVQLRSLYDHRLDIARVAIHHIRMPFNKPFQTAQTTLYERDLLIIEVVDQSGRVGLGECCSFLDERYLPETIPQDIRALQEVIAPALVGRVLYHPKEASKLFADIPQAETLPNACASLEMAVWDLFGQVTRTPLWRLIGGDDALSTDGICAEVPAGAVVGLLPLEETLKEVSRCVAEGYTRVKLKIAPGDTETRVKTVRDTFPELTLALDANASFSDEAIAELQKLDAEGIAWVEEPLAFTSEAPAGSDEHFALLNTLQENVSIPICLDESITCCADAYRALKYPLLRSVMVKIGKFGGVQPALDYVGAAHDRQISVFVGGMYETGVSKGVHAALQTLPEVSGPGDIGSITRYYPADIAVPAHKARGGIVSLNKGIHHYGLGVTLDREALHEVEVARFDVEA